MESESSSIYSAFRCLLAKCKNTGLNMDTVRFLVPEQQILQQVVCSLPEFRSCFPSFPCQEQNLLGNKRAIWTCVSRTAVFASRTEVSLFRKIFFGKFEKLGLGVAGVMAATRLQ